MIQFATKTYGKKDAPGFLPADLKKNFAAYTGRSTRTAEQIQEMVDSLLANGQKVPITVRRSTDGAAVPVTGHTRILAADIINEKKLRGYRLDPIKNEIKEIQYGPENPFILNGLFQAMSEVDAIFASFTENADRNPLTDVDYALFIQTAKENTGMSDADIAKKLGKPASFISTHLKVLELDLGTQKELEAGGIAFDVAINTVAKIEPKKRAAVIARAKADNNGRATGAAITRAAAAEGAKVTGPMKRTDADVKKFMDDYIADHVVSSVTALFFGFKDFRAGTITAEELTVLADAAAGTKK